MDSSVRPIYVVSDAHLGAADPETERIKSDRLHAFWRRTENDGADLVVLGDLFDFWFEYRNAIPRFHFSHLMALRRLVELGRRVWYVAGNHDFWAGPFLRDELGVVYCEDELRIEYLDRNLCLAHGDGWPASERGYRLMKRVFRSPISIALFRLIPPDIGFPFARWVSGKSRGRHYLPDHVLRTYHDLAFGRIRAGADVLVIGHLHVPHHVRWKEGEWVVSGDWTEHFTYAAIDARGVRLMRWRDDGHDEQIEAVTETELRLESSHRL